MPSDSQQDAPQRYAPPKAQVADVRADGGLELAGRGARFVAVLIDFIVLMAAFWVVSLVTPWNIFKPDPDPGFRQEVLAALGSLVVFLVIQAWPLIRRGQTVGKIVMGLRIVRRDGSTASPLHVLVLRYLLPYLLAPFTVLVMIYSLVDALFIFRADRRCVHDLIADTIVVKI